MLAFGIRYLSGFVAAAEFYDLARAEWPPHPGRIFMAMAAAHFQTGADPGEREALLWLEGSARGGEISPPCIAAPDCMQRAVVRHYVPVNDKAGPSKANMQSLTLTRDRQERTFARAWLGDEFVYCLWPDLDPPETHRRALAQLCAKVTRIGHSSSLVQMWMADAEETREPDWLPDESRATIHLRIAGPGTLEYLEQEYNAMAIEDYTNLQVEAETADNVKTRKAARRRLKDDYGKRPPPQQRPRLSLFQGYARPASPAGEESVPGTVFDPHCVVLKFEREDSVYRVLDLVSTLNVISRWREALISYSNDESDRIRSLISGHDPDGKLLKDPHLAFMPMPFVGAEHADSHLLGMALALPTSVTRDERREVLRVIRRVCQLKLGPLGVWHLSAVTESYPRWSLRPETWTAWPEGATHWSTVTPVAFDRHPRAGNKVDQQREVAAIIANSCGRIGLPTPREVIVTPVSAHPGTPPSHVFPKLTRKDGSNRRHTHAILVFDEPVCGPILIGAGRFRGYGVCRRLDSGDSRLEGGRGRNEAGESGMTDTRSE